MPNPIIEEFRACADPADADSEIHDVWFTCAEALWLAGAPIPADWRFRPSPFLSTIDLDDDDDRTRWVDEQTGMYGEIAAELIAAELEDDVLYAGLVLARYGRWLGMAGD